MGHIPANSTNFNRDGVNDNRSAEILLVDAGIANESVLEEAEEEIEEEQIDTRLLNSRTPTSHCCVHLWH